jgi:hypothetical protein
MKEIEVWYMHYHNTGTGQNGISVNKTKAEAEKVMEHLSEFEPYKCMKVTGPHKHEVP